MPIRCTRVAGSREVVSLLGASARGGNFLDRRYAVSGGLLRLACSIQLDKHEPCVNSPRKKALQILMWIRQRLVEQRTQAECKKVESREGVAQGRPLGNVIANRRS